MNTCAKEMWPKREAGRNKLTDGKKGEKRPNREKWHSLVSCTLAVPEEEQAELGLTSAPCLRFICNWLKIYLWNCGCDQLGRTKKIKSLFMARAGFLPSGEQRHHWQVKGQIFVCFFRRQEGSWTRTYSARTAGKAQKPLRWQWRSASLKKRLPSFLELGLLLWQQPTLETPIFSPPCSCHPWECQVEEAEAAAESGDGFSAFPFCSMGRKDLP